jgi:serine kinase of HPr protein (carbohydrate metabolism regulator)
LYKSFYHIVNSSICLETPAFEINDFCNYMWQEFPSVNNSATEIVIRVVPCADKNDYYSVFKGEIIAFDWGEELREVPYARITKTLENIVSGYAINQLDKKEMITLHSGAVSRNNKGILILGESGNGKSTLTLELVANHHWLYLTDEVGMLDAHHVIHPFLKTVSYKRECVVKIDDKWEVRQFGIDYQVAVPKEKHGTAVQLRAIFFVKYEPEAEPSITQIKRSESLMRLLGSQIGRAKSVVTVEQMAEVVKEVNSFQIFHNNVTEAARQITKLVDTL